MKEHMTQKDYDRFCKGEMDISEVNAFIEGLINEGGERILRGLPQMVDFLVQQAGTVRKLADEFYRDYPDLVGHKDLVRKILEKVEAENPGKKYGELLKKVGPEVREKLRKHEEITAVEKPFSLRKLNEDLGQL